MAASGKSMAHTGATKYEGCLELRKICCTTSCVTLANVVVLPLIEHRV